MAINRWRLLRLLVFGILFLGLVLSIIFFIYYKKTHITTDNAYVRGHIHWVYPRINGSVIQVLVEDNQSVKKGQILVLLDPEEYKVKLLESKAELGLALSRLKEAEVHVKAVKAEVNLNKAEFAKAEADFRRAKVLYQKRVISKEKYERYLTNYEVSQAKLMAIKQSLKQAKMQIKTAKENVNLCKRKVEVDQLNLKYTTIIAPVSGYITKKSVEVGQRVNPNRPLLAVVPLDEIWIEANYKEGQLEKIRPGQRVKIKIDAYPDKRFYGQVESIQAGTGAVFSLFPPENATGNWVKVTQRIPVKIVFTHPNNKDNKVLRIGMSAVTTVLVK